MGGRTASAARARRRRSSARPRPAAGDACGCAMGARFLAAALVLASAWYGWAWHLGRLGAGGAVLRVLLCAWVASAAGKALGMALFRRRLRDAPLRPGSAR